MTSDDYKNYRPQPSAFQIITEEHAGWLLAALVLACFVVDWLSR